MKLYHYTIADRLVKILINGYLKLTPENYPLLENEKKAVWLSNSDKWCKTAFYGYPDAALDNAGRIRITIDSANIKAEYAEAVQHYLGDWESLVWSAMEIGVSYKTWYVSFEVIPLNKVESIELWKDDKWVKVPII